MVDNNTISVPSSHDSDSMFRYTRPTNTSINKSNRRPTYAQWISKAIGESASKAITLADINEWMIRNVPGLLEQRYLHSCKGWKNAVRHTLSINRHRFKKVTRDGKPSLWRLISADCVNSISDESNIQSSDISDYHQKYQDLSSIKVHSETIGRPHSNELCDQIPQIISAHANAETRQTSTHAHVNVQNVTENVCQAKNVEQATTVTSTQTLEIMYADGVLGKIVLPMPLPISSLNFGGFLLNSATNTIPVTTSSAPMPQQSSNWTNTVSNMALARQMSMNNNSINLMWDLFSLCDIMKYNNYL